MKLIDDIRRDNLAQLAKECGSVQSLAAVLERDPSQVSQWLNGSTNSATGKPRGMRQETARRIEQALRKPTGWLDLDHNRQFSELDSNTEPGPDVRGRVPLISWIQAGDWCEAVNSFAPGDAEMWLPCPKTFGANAFALRVRGISMEPRYQSGDIIFVDPDVQPEHGKNIVVRLDDETEATFKQLVVEGSQKYLKALNPDFPGPRFLPINGNATIVGVVIGKWVPE